MRLYISDDEVTFIAVKCGVIVYEWQLQLCFTILTAVINFSQQQAGVLPPLLYIMQTAGYKCKRSCVFLSLAFQIQMFPLTRERSLRSLVSRKDDCFCPQSHHHKIHVLCSFFKSFSNLLFLFLNTLDEPWNWTLKFTRSAHICL